MKHHVSIENAPDFETKVEFNYPTDKLPVDVAESLERYTNNIIHLKMAEAVRRLLLLLENEKNPKIMLEALLYSIGLHPLDSNGTMSGVAKQLNISRQRFHYQTKNMPKRILIKIEQLKKHGNNPFNTL